jgi:hypothetical protein
MHHQRLISWRLRRFRTLTSPISVIPTAHQKHAPSARWVTLTDTQQRLILELALTEVLGVTLT